MRELTAPQRQALALLGRCRCGLRGDKRVASMKVLEKKGLVWRAPQYDREGRTSQFWFLTDEGSALLAEARDE